MARFDGPKDVLNYVPTKTKDVAGFNRGTPNLQGHSMKNSFCDMLMLV